VTVRVYPSLDVVVKAAPGGRVVALGVFDGVHLGHQAILREAAGMAGEVGASSTVVTFDPHPDTVLRPRSAPRILTSLERKAELLAGLGIDELVVVKFDRGFSMLSPEAFCRLVLSTRLGARSVFVGENFRFGHLGEGTAERLREYGAEHGFLVRPVSLVDQGGRPVSSTRIREELRAGHVEQAARLLGRPHRVEGEVVRGAGRGRTLDAPTANLAIPVGVALPRLGVYATRSIIDREVVQPSVTSVGTNPTFYKDRKVRVETLLLDYSGELYGSHIAVDFLERIRAQRTFTDAGSLAAHIQKDIIAARKAHARA